MQTEGASGVEVLLAFGPPSGPSRAQRLEYHLQRHDFPTLRVLAMSFRHLDKHQSCAVVQGERITGNLCIENSYLNSLPFYLYSRRHQMTSIYASVDIFPPKTSYYMHTPTSAPLSDSARPLYHLMRKKLQHPATIFILVLLWSVQAFIIHPWEADCRQHLHRQFLP